MANHTPDNTDQYTIMNTTKRILNCRPDQQAIVLYPHKTKQSVSWRRYTMQGFLCGYIVEKLFGIRAKAKGGNPIKLEIRTTPKKGFKAIYPHAIGDVWGDKFDVNANLINVSAYQHFTNYINRYFPRQIESGKKEPVAYYSGSFFSYRCLLYIRATEIHGDFQPVLHRHYSVK